MAVLPNSFRRFGHFLALTVPSAVGFKPVFLLDCCLTPKGRYDTQPHDVTGSVFDCHFKECYFAVVRIL